MARTKSSIRIDQLIDALRPFQADQVYLFGSAAREEEDELSDLDLVIIKRTELPFFDRLREVAKLLPPEIGGVDIPLSLSRRCSRNESLTL